MKGAPAGLNLSVPFELFVKHQRMDHWRESGRHEHRRRRPNVGLNDHQQKSQDTSRDHNNSRKAMRGFPDSRIGQRPGRAHADIEISGQAWKDESESGEEDVTGQPSNPSHP